VVLPIATTIKQSKSINDFAESITDDKIISFGSLHPLQEDYDYILKDLKERGFKGIKLHPEYQQSFIDSKESLRILKLAEELDLLTVLHTGADIGMDPPVHCAPDRLKNVLSEVSGSKIIAAHLGGWKMWDEVEKHLVGSNIIFDTAFTIDFISSQQYKRIIENHGADKILFGTDSPWENPQHTLDGLKSLNLSDDDFDLITHKNAIRILGL
jgi:predicted TIM-barrel fold metal-dependent hydrolase